MTSKPLFKSLCLATSALCTQIFTPVLANAAPDDADPARDRDRRLRTTRSTMCSGPISRRPATTINNLLTKGIVNADGAPGPLSTRPENHRPRHETQQREHDSNRR